MKNERGIQSETSYSIINRGFIHGFDDMEEAQLIPQVAPNNNVQQLRVSVPEGDLFVKTYIASPLTAEKEYKHYLIFQDLSFIPKLHFRMGKEGQRRLLAYDFIEGGDLHQQFTALRRAGQYPDFSMIVQAFEQMKEMGDSVERVVQVDTLSQTPWPLKSPIRKGFLSNEEEAKFLEDYSFVHRKNQYAMDEFPGYYFDRNPRNVMNNESGVVQVDLGIIERSSPLFDIAKFLRNGTDVILPEGTTISDAKTRDDLLDSLAIIPPNSEEYFLMQIFKINFPDLDEPGFENFKDLYLFAALHSHIFYLTKYGKMLRDNRGVRDKLFSRTFYHVGMAYRTLSALEEKGESVEELRNWISYFSSVIQRPNE